MSVHPQFPLLRMTCICELRPCARSIHPTLPGILKSLQELCTGQLDPIMLSVHIPATSLSFRV
jgi:hypothetical protein